MLNRYTSYATTYNGRNAGISTVANGNRLSAAAAAVPAGHIFGFVVFLMFCLPSKQLSRFLLLGVQTNFMELGTLLLPFLYFFLYRRPIAPAFLSRRSQALFLAFVASLGLAGCLFIILHGPETLQSYVFHNLRGMTPFLSAGLVAIQGIKIDQRIFLRWLFLSLLTSYVILVVTYVTGYQRITEFEGMFNISATVRQGRFSNQNWQFGTIGIFLLLDPLKRVFCTTTFDRWLVFTVAMLSIVQMVLGFNRTFLALATIELFAIQIYIARARPSVVIKTALIIIIAAGTMIAAYHLSYDVQRQIDNRIIVVSGGLIQAVEDAWDPTKSQTSRGSIIKISIVELRKSWILGIKPGEPLVSEKLAFKIGWREVYQPDTAILAVWLRFGFIPVFFFVLFWLSLIADMWREGADSRRDGYWRNYAKATAVILGIYVLGSINTSSITMHNAVLFGLLFPFLWRNNVSRPGGAMFRKNGC